MIQLIKLITGEDLVAEMEHSPDTFTVILTNPIKIGLAERGLAMMQFCPFLKSTKIKIHKDHILCHGDVEEEIANAYNVQFGTGLVLPPGNIQLG